MDDPCPVVASWRSLLLLLSFYYFAYVSRCMCMGALTAVALFFLQPFVDDSNNATLFFFSLFPFFPHPHPHPFISFHCFFLLSSFALHSPIYSLFSLSSHPALYKLILVLSPPLCYRSLLHNPKLSNHHPVTLFLKHFAIAFAAPLFSFRRPPLPILFHFVFFFLDPSFIYQSAAFQDLSSYFQTSVTSFILQEFFAPFSLQKHPRNQQHITSAIHNILYFFCTFLYFGFSQFVTLSFRSFFFFGLLHLFYFFHSFKNNTISSSPHS